MAEVVTQIGTFSNNSGRVESAVARGERYRGFIAGQDKARKLLEEHGE